MFEIVDIMISFGIIFLILSMTLKYIMSFIKRFLNIKATVVSDEMKAFVGEKTSEIMVSYLSKEAKSLNLLENVKKKGETEGLRQLKKEHMDELVERLDKFLEGKSAEQVYLDLGIRKDLDNAKENIKIVKEQLVHLKGRAEQLYDNTIEKVSSIYKKKLRQITLICGILLAMVMNADFFEIYHSLSTNSMTRDMLVAKSESIQNRISELSVAVEESGNQGDSLGNVLKDARKAEKELEEQLSSAGLSLGWNRNILNQFKKQESILGKIFIFINKLIGLLISGFLISFGAPFWHDFLSTFTGIKGILRGGLPKKSVSPAPPRSET